MSREKAVQGSHDRDSGQTHIPSEHKAGKFDEGTRKEQGDLQGKNNIMK